ncbi:MAG: hypothetical protein HC892_23145, partial [Saprospiraceae bacterium]|nr:hypothetical protein [Saprospiraceae bacterium]
SFFAKNSGLFSPYFPLFFVQLNGRTLRITVFADRIEIMSPGELHWGVDKEKFLNGKASAKWRNQSFTYLFNKLQLAQSEGQGIPTIFRTMKEEGCPDPSFEIETDSITCILPAHPRHRMVRELQEIQDKIILGRLDEAKEQTFNLLETDLYNFRTLDLYCEIIAKQKRPQELYHLYHLKIWIFMRLIQIHSSILQKF